MTQRTIGPDGNDDQKIRNWSYSEELRQLHKEWHDVNGTDIPPHIAIMPLDGIRSALKFSKLKYEPVSQMMGNDDSMMTDDNHNKY